MDFIKYNSIENTTNKMLYEFKASELYDKNDLWVVTEKVDGSNFSFCMGDDGNLIPGKRSSFLSPTSSFFNFQKVIDKYGDGVKKLIEASKQYLIEIGSEYICDVSIHGELCGGFYPNVPAILNAKAVQNRVRYSNDTEFIVFDICGYDVNGNRQFIDHRVVNEYCNQYGVPSVPVIFEGTFDECIAWSTIHNADDSQVWEIFSMPNPVPNNIREGNVIKPVKTLFKGDHRIIFKDKNTKFKENNGEKPNKEAKIVYSDNLMVIIDDVCEMVCINRFNSVTSKFGDYSIKNFQELMILMSVDIYDEINRDAVLKEKMNKLTDVDKRELHNILIKQISKFMGKNKKEIF